MIEFERTIELKYCVIFGKHSYVVSDHRKFHVTIDRYHTVLIFVSIACNRSVENIRFDGIDIGWPTSQSLALVTMTILSEIKP